MPKPVKADVPPQLSINHPGLRKLIDDRGEKILERRGPNKRLDQDEAEFWLCLVFQSNTQMQEFIAQIPEVPVLYNSYIDGETFAERVKLPVTPCTKPPIKGRAVPLGKKIAMSPVKKGK